MTLRMTLAPLALALAFSLWGAGCAELNAELDRALNPPPQPVTRIEQPEPVETPSEGARMGSRISVWIDGQPASLMADQIKHIVRRPVPQTATFRYAIDDSIGIMRSCIVNVYEVKPDNSYGEGIYAVTDFNQDAKTLVPGREIRLTSPKASVIDLRTSKPAESLALTPGKRYILRVVVSGSENNDTHDTIFTMR